MSYEFEDIEDDNDYEEIDEDVYDEFGEVIVEDEQNTDDEEKNEEEYLNLDEEDEENMKEVKKKKTKIRISQNWMTEYEYDRLLGSLSRMIAEGMNVDPKVFEYAKIDGIKKMDSSLKIAKYWLDNSKRITFPISLSRTFPDGTADLFYVDELLLPNEI